MRFWYITTPKATAKTDEEKKPAPAEVYVYGDIGEPEYWDDVVDRQFVQDIAALDTDAINLHINSRGGSLFAGLAMYNSLRAHRATVTAYVEGLAASAASIVAVGADRVVMRRGAMMMLHQPRALAAGTADELDDAAAMLRKSTESLVAIYRARMGTEDEDQIRAMLARDTWLSAEECVSLGLADEADETAPAIAASLHAEGRMAVVNGLAFAEPGDALKDAIAPKPEAAKAAPAPDLSQIRAEAAAAERARILAIDAATLPGYEADAAAAKESGTVTAADHALAQVRQERQRRQQLAQDHVADAVALARAIPPAPAPPADPAAQAQKQEATAWSEMIGRLKSKAAAKTRRGTE